MSRPWVLVCLLLLIVFTSQFEWKQQYGNELEPNPSTSNKQQYVSEREESVKEKVSFSLFVYFSEESQTLKRWDKVLCQYLNMCNKLFWETEMDSLDSKTSNMSVP